MKEEGKDPFTEEELNSAKPRIRLETIQIKDKKTGETEFYYKEGWIKNKPFWIHRVQDAYNFGIIKVYNERTNEIISFFIKRKKGESEKKFYENFEERMKELEDKMKGDILLLGILTLSKKEILEE